MTKVTTIYHPRPDGVWPEGEPDSVRAAYDLTRAAGAQPAAVTQEAMALAAGGPDLEPEA
jgi:hypothetical protein